LQFRLEALTFTVATRNFFSLWLETQ
jgi:hypothetical protein